MQYPRIEREHGSAYVVCAEATPRFNCHGMTFASRRTCIFESSELMKILKEDGYELIQAAEVSPGDVIVYVSDDGDFEHSGIVVEVPKALTLNIASVRSKWGKFKEVIHPANRCPYTYNVRYYRIKE